MAIEAKPGTNLRVTITKKITREGARKTLERLFLQDKTVWTPLEARERNFKPIPKRRGGRIWTKRVNKLHPAIEAGKSATVTATMQTLRDLKSVESFVEVAAA